MAQVNVPVLHLLLSTFSLISTYKVSLALQHRGPHICRSNLDNQQCCPGWKQRPQDQLCLIPVCRYGCGKYGNCVSPNVCQCHDGSMAPVCTVTADSNNNDTCTNYSCHQLCRLHSGLPTCSCFSGFYLHSDFKTCIDVDECRQSTDCKYGCMNTIGSFKCFCDPGQKESSDVRENCVEAIDQVASSDDGISKKSIFNNLQTLQASLCPRGYSYKSVLGFCSDIDECNEIQGQKCHQICINSPGSFHCLCHQGYILQYDGLRCKKERNYNRCSPECANGGTCANGRCVCPVGIQGEACEQDVNECEERADKCGYKCRNTFGSFHCICQEGYVLNADLKTCRAISCIPQCMNGGSCVNGKCVCPPGFKGKSCGMDRNECKENIATCQYMCRNTYGSYACLCPPRSFLKPDKYSCTFTRVCLHKCRNGGTCMTGKCICPTGFSGRTCRIDQNECSVGKSGCSHGCYNTYGSYRCYCPRNMTLSSDGKMCSKSGYNAHVKEGNVEENSKNTSRERKTDDDASNESELKVTQVKKVKLQTDVLRSTPSTSSVPKYTRNNNVASTESKTSSTPVPTTASRNIPMPSTTNSQVKNTEIGKNEPTVQSKKKDIRKLAATLFDKFSIFQKPNKNASKEMNNASMLTLKDNGERGIAAGSYVMTVNKKIVNSMVDDFKSRRRAIRIPTKIPSGVLISAKTKLPCFYQGSQIGSGLEFSTDEHNCTKCKCSDGELRCSKILCPELHCPTPIRGQCCNRCPEDCVFDKKVRQNGEYFSPKNDPCKTCSCSAGLVTCQDAPCPNLECAVESQFLPPGQCCAECIMVKKVVSKISRNIKGCNHRNILYDIGDSWVDSEDNCTLCECQNRESVECFSLDCVKDLCDNALVKGCCSTCNECSVDGQIILNGAATKRKTTTKCEECTCNFGELNCVVKPCDDGNCHIRGNQKEYFYKHGDIFNLPHDPCVNCLCKEGEVSCFATECQARCRHGVKATGKCCSDCEDCKYRGNFYKNHAQFKFDETCEECACSDGTVTCNRQRYCS